jgi:putative solute:sodium symporter small subunit
LAQELATHRVLLAIWFVSTFVMAYFARPLAEIVIFGWPLSFYMAAQGSLIIYLVIIWYYAKSMKKLDRSTALPKEKMMSAQVSSNRAFFNQLKKYYTYYTGGFITFVVVLTSSSSSVCRGCGSAMCSCSPPSRCTRASAS